MITSLDYLKAGWQFFSRFFLVKLPCTLLGLVMVPLGYFFIQKGKPNRYGELTQEHSDKYKLLGSSGQWDFWNMPRFLWIWGNDEDGLLGEPSGKHSARVRGKERSFWGIYQWAALRNPANNLRYSEILSCYVDRCDLVWSGASDLLPEAKFPVRIALNDNNPVKPGWYFVKATDRTNSKVYYCYRLVKPLKSGRVLHIRLGFKIKPKHAFETQDIDDANKGFTVRIAAPRVN